VPSPTALIFIARLLLSPNTPIFIPCIILQRLLAPSLVMLSFILLRRFKKEAERKCYLEKILWDKENLNFEKNQRTLKGPKQELFVAKFFTQFKPVWVEEIKLFFWFGPDVCDFGACSAYAQGH
jgi:hypothetical protein